MTRHKSQFERIFGKAVDADSVSDPIVLELHALRERVATLEELTRSHAAPSRPEVPETGAASKADEPPTDPAPAEGSVPGTNPTGAPAPREVPPGFEDPAAFAVIATNTAMLPQPGEGQEAYEQRLIGAGLTMSQAMPTLLALEADGALPTSIMAEWPARKAATAQASNPS